jgi:hypothetical protein
VANAAVAGQTAVNSSSVDMRSFGAVSFILSMGSITSTGVQSAKLQQSSDDDTADAWADIEGSSITIADDDDNQCVFLDLVSPRERYVRCVVSRGTANSVVDGVIALQYLAKQETTTHDSTTVVGSEVALSPAEGTA